MYRPLSHFFRQNFQSGDQPADRQLREYRVMSLKTRFGNLKNVLDEDSSQTEIRFWKAPLWPTRSSRIWLEAFDAPLADRSTVPLPPALARILNALQAGLERMSRRS